MKAFTHCILFVFFVRISFCLSSQLQLPLPVIFSLANQLNINALKSETWRFLLIILWLSPCLLITNTLS